MFSVSPSEKLGRRARWGTVAPSTVCISQPWRGWDCDGSSRMTISRRAPPRHLASKSSFPADMPFARLVDGGRLHYAERGERREGATPALLVHGAGASSAIWMMAMARIARAAHVVAIDLPG